MVLRVAQVGEVVVTMLSGTCIGWPAREFELLTNNNMRSPTRGYFPLSMETRCSRRSKSNDSYLHTTTSVLTPRSLSTLLSRAPFRGGGRGYQGRGGRGGDTSQAGANAPFQCKHVLDGACTYGPSRCRFIHGVEFHTNGVDLEAHEGAVRGLASDANCLYTFGEDGVIKTYSWTPGKGCREGEREQEKGHT